MNIRLRLTLWYSAILFLILLVFSGAVYIGLSRSLFASLDNHLRREVGQIVGNIKFETQDVEGEEEEEETKEHLDHRGEIELEYIPEEGVYWRILDAQGQPLIDPGYFDQAAFVSAPLDTQQIHLQNATLRNGTPIRLHTAPFVFEQHGAGIVQVAESYEYIQEVQRQLVMLLALSIPFTLLAASVGGWFLASNALAPIDRITRAAQQISANYLHRRLNLNLPDDEVGRLATTFDQMLARLEDAFERQKRFIADASHEMRTPLTILKGDVEVALNRPRTAEEYRETLEMVGETTDRLTTLVQELFLLARADNNQYPLELEAFNLAELLAKRVAQLKPHALKKKINLQLQTPTCLPVKADPDKLARLFLNLIDNAIKYSGPGTVVTITATIRVGQACVTVNDTGPGIPPEHLPHLFERFYRIDKARSQAGDQLNSSGAGLGLSIAQWLAQLHGGRIEVASQVGRGSIFTVWLPLQPAATDL